MLTVVTPSAASTIVRVGTTTSAVVSWNTRAERGRIDLCVYRTDGQVSRWLPYVSFGTGRTPVAVRRRRRGAHRHRHRRIDGSDRRHRGAQRRRARCDCDQHAGPSAFEPPRDRAHDPRRPAAVAILGGAARRARLVFADVAGDAAGVLGQAARHSHGRTSGLRSALSRQRQLGLQHGLCGTLGVARGAGLSGRTRSCCPAS